MAAAIAVLTWTTWSAVALGAGLRSGSARTASFGGTVAGVPALLVSIAVIALVVGITEILALVLPPRPTPTPPPVVRRLPRAEPEPNGPASEFPGPDG
jgi:hypothetical protein